jgi:hypothetical protein
MRENGGAGARAAGRLIRVPLGVGSDKSPRSPGPCLPSRHPCRMFPSAPRVGSSSGVHPHGLSELPHGDDVRTSAHRFHNGTRPAQWPYDHCPLHRWLKCGIRRPRHSLLHRRWGNLLRIARYRKRHDQLGRRRHRQRDCTRLLSSSTQWARLPTNLPHSRGGHSHPMTVPRNPNASCRRLTSMKALHVSRGDLTKSDPSSPSEA